MIVLVLGGSGLLGGALVRGLQEAGHEVHATLRQQEPFEDFGRARLQHGVDVLARSQLKAVLAQTRPDVVVNAVGIVKQRTASVEDFIKINALFPQWLARTCADIGSRCIHVSTDCVFSGRRGNYCEDDISDPVDVYGMTKRLGEPVDKGAVVLRCSMIGLKRARAGTATHGLVNWLLAQSGSVDGYARAVFSGLTTRELSRVIAAICRLQQFSGLWHVAAAPISKYELLLRLVTKLPELGLQVRPINEPVLDRSLDGRAFVARTGYTAPSWDAMLEELAAEIRSSQVCSRRLK